ncbi:MAG TPA: hypothetical protein VK861_10150 [Bacteroidales bacterium]|nr:hypothetical protein [Bacteroidales bacterium]
MQNKSIFLAGLLLFSFLLNLSGQKMVNSPYARFNIGLLEPAGSFRSLGMGGTSVSFRDNTSIYFSNPASYTSIDTNSFVFDFGIDYSINRLMNGETRFTSDDMNFDHLLMGFPLGKNIGVAAGLVPFSNGYYKLAETIRQGDPGYDPVTGEYSSNHLGEGSFINFFAGAGIKFLRHFSAGANMTILFGQIKRTNRITFSDYESVFHYNRSENLRIGGVNFDYGLQAALPVNKNYFINAGISLTSGKRYNSDYEDFSYLFSAYNTADTLSYFTGGDQKAYIPGTLRAGLSLGRKDKMTASFDYITTKWSKAEILGAEGYLADTRSLHFGIEFIPEKYTIYDYFRRIEYRAGAHIENNYVIINNEQIKGYGFTAGLGIPVRRSLSKANIFFDYTVRSGSFDNNLHRENYYTMGISLNLHDYWFLKRRYD